MTLEFQAWPRISRFGNETVQVTEKIDGSNACVVVLPFDEKYSEHVHEQGIAKWVDTDEGLVLFATQSRRRFIWPGKQTDNAGFAGWAWENASALVQTLGYGKHFGEWYGAGIQHGYGLKEKRFALFNASRWQDLTGAEVPGIGVVPVLYDGPFADLDGPDIRNPVKESIESLRQHGSLAVPGYMSPEGVIAYFRLARVSYKAFLHNNTTPKGLQ